MVVDILLFWKVELLKQWFDVKDEILYIPPI